MLVFQLPLLLDSKLGMIKRKASVTTEASSSHDKKLITRWDSERELFYDDIAHALQNNNIYGSIAEVCSHAKIRLAVEFESSSE